MKNPAPVDKYFTKLFSIFSAGCFSFTPDKHVRYAEHYEMSHLPDVSRLLLR